MNIKPLSIPRSDLAIELAQSLLKQENTCEKSSKTLPEGLSVHTQKHGSVEITCVRITTPAVAQKLQKPRGKYITIQTPPLWNSLLDPQDEINAQPTVFGSCCPPMEVYWSPDLATIRSLQMHWDLRS